MQSSLMKIQGIRTDPACHTINPYFILVPRGVKRIVNRKIAEIITKVIHKILNSLAIMV
jgi:hypothetical protein